MSNFMKMTVQSPCRHYLFIMQWSSPTICQLHIKTIFPAINNKQIFRKLKKQKKKAVKTAANEMSKFSYLTTSSFSRIGQEFMFPSSFSLHYPSSLLVGPHRTSD